MPRKPQEPLNLEALMGNKPPQALDVEEAVLGAMLVEPATIDESMEELSAGCFYDPRHRKIFEAMSALVNEHVSIDIVTVSEKLRPRGDLEEIGGPVELARLSQNIGAAAHIEYYIKILKQKTIQRDLITASYDILKQSFDESTNVDDLIDNAQTKVFAAIQNNVKRDVQDIGSIINSVLDNKYSEYFGFTPGEVKDMAAYYHAEDKFEDLRQWYDGYRFGQADIFNPWSVISFIDNDCIFQPYWLNTSGNSILQALLARIDARKEADLKGLLQGKTLSAPVNENIIYSDLNSDRDALYMMLLTSGYLKAVKTWKDENYEDWAALQIPNLEIRRAFRLEVEDNIVPHQGAIVLKDLMAAMTEGRAEDFAKYLSELLRDFVSFHDSDHNPESFYHGLLLGLSVWLDGRYRVESNKEAGYGRFDIAFFPLRENVPGVILELKTVKAQEEMEAAAKAALAQIEAKAYLAEFARQGVAAIWTYGIAFCGKKVWLEHK